MYTVMWCNLTQNHLASVPQIVSQHEIIVRPLPLPTAGCLGGSDLAVHGRTVHAPPRWEVRSPPLQDWGSGIYRRISWGATPGLMEFHQPVKELKSPSKIFIECPYDFASEVTYTVNVRKFELVKKKCATPWILPEIRLCLWSGGIE